MAGAMLTSMQEAWPTVPWLSRADRFGQGCWVWLISAVPSLTQSQHSRPKLVGQRFPWLLAQKSIQS